MILYTILKISAIIAAILLIVKGPKKKKAETLSGNSDYFVHQDGLIECVKSDSPRYQEH